MKIEQLIVQYLYINKQVTLQGIGTFTLDPSVVLPVDNEKDKNFVMPENAFQFDYNLKAAEDPGLITFIVEHTRKIYPLASSDLESYSMLAKQFLNIGKPLVIDGVGTIQKNQAGNYQFTPGLFITPRIDDIPKQLREKRDESVSFESEARIDNSRRNLMIGLGVLLVILGGLGIYYYFSTIKKDTPDTTLADVPAADTTVVSDSLMSTTPLPVPDSSKPATSSSIPAPDGSSFKIVLKNYTSAVAAQNAFRRLTTYGHQLELLTADSTSFEIAMPFTTPLSDTTRARDSLRRFFGGSPYVKR